MLQNPFDDDMNVLPPEPPKIDDGSGKYTNWPSAEGYETVPANWKPKAGRELPALRCTHERDDGSRCKNFGVRGTGFNGTPSMCFVHGGSLPPVKAKAEATLQIAKMRLVQETGVALDTLFDLTKVGTSDQIRLKAATEILDRAGIKGGVTLDIEVNHNVSAADEIRKKLTMISDRMKSDAEPELVDEGEEIIDAEEVDDEEKE